MPTWIIMVSWTTLLYLIVMTGGSFSAFIYFQF